MFTHFWGTRGSVPVAAGRYTQKYGGNTTALEIGSMRLPEGFFLAIDAGSGFVPFGIDASKRGIKELLVLHTHWHHDHIQGWPLSSLVYNQDVQVHCWGPLEGGVGPRQMLDGIMKPPYFPVSFDSVSAHINCKAIKNPCSHVIVIHREGGFKKITVAELTAIEQRESSQIKMSSGSYNLNDCLVIKMLYTHHPERTISYRIEDRASGEVIVILTDHENLDGLPKDLIRHLSGADLLIMDCQYSRAMYDARTSGFGHATPDYCARTAHQVGAKQLALTHHDPASTDFDIDQILTTAELIGMELGYEGEIVAAKDYQRISVSKSSGDAANEEETY